MSTITNLYRPFADKFKCIHQSESPNSDTGYNYCFKHENVCVMFYDSLSRQNLMIQLIMTDADGNDTPSGLLLHNRYEHHDSIVACSTHADFYNDCIIHSYNADKFQKRFDALFAGETVPCWSQTAYDEMLVEIANGKEYVWEVDKPSGCTFRLRDPIV